MREWLGCLISAVLFIFAVICLFAVAGSVN